MSWTPPTDGDLGAAQTPGTGTAPVRADLTYVVLQRLRDGIAGVYTAAVQAISGLSPAADTFVYFTSTTAASLASITAFARGFLTQGDAASMRTYIGAGTGSGGAPAAHESSHLSGGTDALSGSLDAVARTNVYHNGTLVAARRAIDLIEGSNVTLGVADDAPNEIVRVTVTPTTPSAAIGDASVLPRHLVGKTGNLVHDPKFEATPFTTVWNITGSVVRVQVASHTEADWGAQFPGGSASDSYLRVWPVDSMPVRGGETFFVSFDSRYGSAGTGPGTSQLQIGMSFTGLLGANLGEVVIGYVVAGTPWVTTSGVLTAPIGAKLANIFLKRPANTDTIAYRATALRVRRQVPLAEIAPGGTALQALRLNAAGNGAESLPFPSVFPAFYIGPAAACWIRGGHWTGTSVAVTPTANTIYYSPFLLPVRYAPTKAGIDVTAAVSGTCDITFWTFDPATGKVGAKVFAASVSTAATGMISATVAPGTLEAGWYVSRLTFGAAPTVRGHQTNVLNPWGVDPTGNNAPTTAKTNAPGSFVTNPSSAEDVAGFTDNSAAVPLLYLQ